jgi:hypothetical protein
LRAGTRRSGQRLGHAVIEDAPQAGQFPLADAVLVLQAVRRQQRPQILMGRRNEEHQNGGPVEGTPGKIGSAGALAPVSDTDGAGGRKGDIITRSSNSNSDFLVVRIRSVCGTLDLRYR